MGGPPGNARAPGLTRLPSKVEYAGRSLGPIQSCQTLWAEHGHLKYSKPINSVFYSSCRPWVDRQDLASVRWGSSGPRLAEHPQQPARRTWLSFRPTESLHTCTSIRSLRVEKKNIDPPCMGSTRTSSCPGVMPWDGSQGSHGSGRVRQFVNCLSHRNVRFFLTSAAYDQSGIIALAQYQSRYYGVPSTTNRMAFACFSPEFCRHETTSKQATSKIWP